MITCPQCGTQAAAGAAFCDNCGASLAGAGAAPAAAPAAGGMTCSQCHQPIIPGQAFCDNCGAAVTAAPAVAPAPPPAAVPPPHIVPQPVAPAPVAPAAGGMVRCAACNALVPANQAFCDSCGASLSAPAGGATLPQAGPAPVAPMGQPAGHARLTTANGAQFDLTGKTQALIGREDPVSGIFPDVDLTPHGGDAGGVSRRHAKLAFNGFQWTIEDLNATNGSWVNNQKLNPGVPQPLNNGDQVRLGRVVLTFQM